MDHLGIRAQRGCPWELTQGIDRSNRVGLSILLVLRNSTGNGQQRLDVAEPGDPSTLAAMLARQEARGGVVELGAVFTLCCWLASGLTTGAFDLDFSSASADVAPSARLLDGCRVRAETRLMARYVLGLVAFTTLRHLGAGPAWMVPDLAAPARHRAGGRVRAAPSIRRS